MGGRLTHQAQHNPIFKWARHDSTCNLFGFFKIVSCHVNLIAVFTKKFLFRCGVFIIHP